MLALPGSAYLYQGEELGLPEVLEIPAERRQDPTFHRTGGRSVGRDGARVPLPWTPDGPSFGFGSGPAHLPQPTWFAGFAASSQAGVAGSTLEFYRRALALRPHLRSDETLEWLPAGGDDLLGFARGGGLRCFCNFGAKPAPLPPGEILVASAPDGIVPGGRLPPNSAIWLA
jgi:alpha-glucosidase